MHHATTAAYGLLNCCCLASVQLGSFWLMSLLFDYARALHIMSAF